MWWGQVGVDRLSQTRQILRSPDGDENLSVQFQNLFESYDHLPTMPRNDKMSNHNAGKHRDKFTYIVHLNQPIVQPMGTG